jgi:hypothetical protein
MVDAPYGVGKNIIPENVFWYNRYNIQTNIYNIYSNITGDIRCASSQCDKNIMGKELGGTGDNISYKFIEEDINIDDEDSCAKKEYF